MFSFCVGHTPHNQSCHLSCPFPSLLIPSPCILTPSSPPRGSGRPPDARHPLNRYYQSQFSPAYTLFAGFPTSIPPFSPFHPAFPHQSLCSVPSIPPRFRAFGSQLHIPPPLPRALAHPRPHAHNIVPFARPSRTFTSLLSPDLESCPAPSPARGPAARPRSHSILTRATLSSPVRAALPLWLTSLWSKPCLRSRARSLQIPYSPDTKTFSAIARPGRLRHLYSHHLPPWFLCPPFPARASRSGTSAPNRPPGVSCRVLVRAAQVPALRVNSMHHAPCGPPELPAVRACSLALPRMRSMSSSAGILAGPPGFGFASYRPVRASDKPRRDTQTHTR
ncbi:hypothetical protein C8Q77DRAFT_485871 [Trametes polyzona]|nr:hypothetical protein C8Q77DRAFT_485871 [Trametes polyzona]